MKRLLPLLALFLAVPLFAAKPLTPPKGRIPVAFVLTESATMIDFAGPWEVFQDVHLPEKAGLSMENRMPFDLYVVSDKRDPIRTTGGMTVVPDHTFATAPKPKVVVIGAQRGRSPEMLAWLRKMAADPEVDVVLSVCTGAFKLAAAGLLDGKQATTHHDFYDALTSQYPKIKLVKSTRFVESDDKISTAGGLTSGIDAALHVVERYFGREVAQRTATYMEHYSDGWKQASR